MNKPDLSQIGTTSEREALARIVEIAIVPVDSMISYRRQLRDRGEAMLAEARRALRNNPASAEPSSEREALERIVEIAVTPIDSMLPEKRQLRDRGEAMLAEARRALRTPAVEQSIDL